MSEQSIKAEQLQDVGFVNLRGNPQDRAFIKAAETVLGQSLPLEANTMSVGDSRVYWLGPDEWLVVAASESTAGLLASLTDALAEHHAAVNDVSGGNIAVSISGVDTRNLFAKGCTLDFHPDVFGVEQCAQSGLGKAAVLFGLLDDAPTFEVIVRRSFAGYLVKWLRHAGREYGIEFA